ncbi:MAG: hypothetical protein QOD70_2021, partial [Frankiales bacterium]|nr:hypothetical protein [Frankiales bacterium]
FGWSVPTGLQLLLVAVIGLALFTMAVVQFQKVE